MRPIKFRAWDKRTKTWFKTELEFNGFDLFGECMLVCPPRMDDLQYLEVTQFTGLFDFRGQEIWEGDIVQHGDNYIVVFNHGGWQISYDDWSMLGYMKEDNSDRTSVEVVGNIYENKELLNESK